MRKLLFILFLFLSVSVFAQTGETKPSTSKVIQAPNNMTWWFNPPDTTLRASMGSFGILKLAGSKQTKHQLDSLAFDTNTQPFVIEVATDGVTTYVLPFKISTSSQVWYNGNLIRPVLWTGLGTIILTVDVDTRIKDYIIIKK